MHVLALNGGSSSLKFGLYAVDAIACDVVIEGEADALGGDDGRIVVRDRDGVERWSERVSRCDARDAMDRIDAWLARSGLPPPDAIGHRIVHGGPRVRRHGAIDDATLVALREAAAFAPLHVPAALAMIDDARARHPTLPQVACLDTAFHADLDERARVLAVPKALRAEGIERYGFHGLSCESIVAQVGTPVPARMVIAHLGNGASVTAVAHGRSIDTSMGLTPTGGVPMGTRSGDLDPGVLLWLLREKKLDAGQLEDLLDRRSGLLGISGTSNDLRRLREAAPSDADARLAIAMFCYAVGKQIAAMIAALDGIDLLVFTGGIGEHDATARAAICTGLRWIGVHLDEAADPTATRPLEAATSRCAIRVVASREDARIARITHDLQSDAADV